MGANRSCCWRLCPGICGFCCSDVPWRVSHSCACHSRGRSEVKCRPRTTWPLWPRPSLARLRPWHCVGYRLVVGIWMSTIMMLLVRNSPELRCGCLCRVEGRGRDLGVGSILTSANTVVSLTWHFTRPPPCLQDLTCFLLSQILTRFWDPPVAASRIPVSCHLRPSPLGLGQYPKENLCRPQTSPAERAGLQVTSH